MKSKYLFINDDEVHENMIVSFVMVGTSKREQSQADKVHKIANTSPDVFFQKWDCQVCDFFNHLAEQVYPLMAPRDAWHKFTLRNVRHTSLSEVLNSLQGVCTPSLLPTQVTL